MNRFLLSLLVLFALPALAQTPLQASGKVQSVQVPEGLTPATALTAACATPATGCAAGQFVSVKVNGRNSVNVQAIGAAVTATWGAYYSTDNGATWTATQIRTNGNGFSSLSNTVANTSVTTFTGTANYLIPLVGGETDVMFAPTALSAGSATAQLATSNTNPNPLMFVVTPKGSQPGTSIGVSTQDLKDAGRSFVVLSADGVTPAATDTAITFSKNVNGTVTATQTTYAITSGKTLRIQSICGSFTAGAAANTARVRLRLNTAGACLVGSGLVLPAMELTPQYGTAAATEGWAGMCVPVPDGLEFTGASWNVCLSASAAAASGTLTVNLIGYEY